MSVRICVCEGSGIVQANINKQPVLVLPQSTISNPHNTASVDFNKDKPMYAHSLYTTYSFCKTPTLTKE